MGIFKKLCMTSMLGVMLAVPTYATVVTGSQSDVNMELKYPLVYTNNMFAQKAINTDIANYVLYAKSVYYDQHAYQVKQNYKVTYEDAQVVSILLTTYHYHAGNAHGMYNTKGLVYNYVKIANPQQIERGINSGILRFYSEGHKKADLLPNWSVEYVSDNYYLKGKGAIGLVYQPYELGPFSYGNTFVEFSPKAIEYFNRMNS